MQIRHEYQIDDCLYIELILASYGYKSRDACHIFFKYNSRGKLINRYMQCVLY